MTAFDSPRPAAPPTAAHSAMRVYTDVLGQPPQLWWRGPCGWTCRDTESAARRWTDVVTDHLGGGPGADGVVVGVGPDRILVALPIEKHRDWAAVCVLKASDLALARRLAAAAITILRGGTIGAAPQAPVSQKTPQFSELGWFRSIVDQVRLCDARIEHSQVADEVLPRLRSQIGAEAVAWVREVPGNGTASSEPIIVWCGDSVVSDAESTEIISKYGRRAMLKPAVCDASTLPSDRGWPTLSGFILVRVPDIEAEGSWLLALNRQAGRDRQFSHFEAGLMQVAAAVLSTHARNLGVLLDQEHVMQRVIHGMSGAIDARDAYTRGHSERVGRFAKRIAMKLRLPTEEIEQLYLTGLLHDIGKIGIPDRVLLKSGDLTTEEFELIKQHPEIGHRILEPISELAYALPGVLHHHERIDGRGYPHGLSGDEIPLSARILAVADAFDAMTSTRTYRAAMTISRAQSILADGRGLQWDSDIVETFLAVLPQCSPEVAPLAAPAAPEESDFVFDDIDAELDGIDAEFDDPDGDANKAKDWASLSMIMPMDLNDLSSTG